MQRRPEVRYVIIANGHLAHSNPPGGSVTIALPYPGYSTAWRTYVCTCICVYIQHVCNESSRVGAGRFCPRCFVFKHHGVHRMGNTMRQAAVVKRTRVRRDGRRQKWCFDEKTYPAKGISKLLGITWFIKITITPTSGPETLLG